LKIITVVGARPQFIKAAVVSKAFKDNGINEILLHTGQHYDYKMSEIFFKELFTNFKQRLIYPKYNLNIGSYSHGKQTGMMLEGIENILVKEKPDFCVVYGDTNSTLAGALASAKLKIPVVHIEAGLRSNNMNMPEEVNRIVTDHISSILFCPTKTAVKNLYNENVKKNVFFVGDVMYDAILKFLPIAEKKSKILKELNVNSKEYFYVTVHRAENTDDKNRLKNIFKGLFSYKGEEKFVIPLHPRTLKHLKKYRMFKDIKNKKNFVLINPVGYFDSLILIKNSKKVLTDSGGIQKEAYILQVPCITLRDETEWIETQKEGWNVLTGADAEKIKKSILNFYPCGLKQKKLFGEGNASYKIVKILKNL
jgi:UDP-N-acetylglucosamine 2-epimerase